MNPERKPLLYRLGSFVAKLVICLAAFVAVEVLVIIAIYLLRVIRWLVS